MAEQRNTERTVGGMEFTVDEVEVLRDVLYTYIKAGHEGTPPYRGVVYDLIDKLNLNPSGERDFVYDLVRPTPATANRHT